MKSYIKNLIIGAGILACATAAQAQTTYSGYFLENYDYRFQMNPAFGNTDNFVSLPGVGNLNLHVSGNLHVSDVIYTLNGKTVLFTNPGISAAEVMGKIGDKNRIGTNNKVDILSAGFKAFKGYNTVSISAVANVDASVPGSFFSLAKEGVTNEHYDIRNLMANANAYAQIAFNHSHDIRQVPGLRVGGALKVLIGAGSLDLRFHEAQLQLDEDNWTALTNADIYASVGGFRYDMKHNDDTNRDYVSGANFDDGYKPQGFGLGFDLGAEYKWNDFRFSAAVLNLGFIAWGKTHWASTNGTQKVETDAYTFNADGDAENSFDNEFKRLKNNLSMLYQLSDNGTLSSHTRALAATVNLGAEWELPQYRKLHFGLLNSTRINGPYTWTQFRLSANVAPVKCLSASVNMEAGTYGVGFGWLLNVHPKYFNLFVGMDHTLGKLAKQGVPLNSNAAVNFGINVPF